MKLSVLKLQCSFVTAVFIIALSGCKKETVANFVPSKRKAAVGEEIQFLNVSEDAKRFLWDFGDGTTSKERSPKKKYNSEGKYAVKLSSYSRLRNRVDKFIDYVEIGNSVEILADTLYSGTPQNILARVTGMATSFDLVIQGYSYLSGYSYFAVTYSSKMTVSSVEELVVLFPKRGRFLLKLTAHFDNGEIKTVARSVEVLPGPGTIEVYALENGLGYSNVSVSAVRYILVIGPNPYPIYDYKFLDSLTMHKDFYPGSDKQVCNDSSIGSSLNFVFQLPGGSYRIKISGTNNVSSNPITFPFFYDNVDVEGDCQSIRFQ